MLNQPKTFSLLVLAMGILSISALAGCQQVVPAGERFVSVQGVNLEAFMPADTFLFVKAGTNDQSQVDAVKLLNGYFPGNPGGTMLTEFNKGFKDGAKLEELGLDYEKDVLPVLNEKSQFFLGMSPRVGDDKMKVNVYLSMTVADTAKFDAILDKELQKNILKKEDYNGQAIYSEVSDSGNPAYLTRYMDAVLMTNSEDNLKTGLENLKAKKDVLANNVNFKKAMTAYKPNLALVYADFQAVISLMSAQDAGNTDLVKAMAGTDAANIQSEMIMFTAEKEGLRASFKVFAKDGVDFTQSKVASASMAAYLFKKIPANSPIMYLESSGVKNSYETMLKTMSADTQFNKGLQQMKDFLASQQLDLEKDVLSIMDKGVAVVFDDTGTPIPSFGVYLDASSNKDGALKVADRLNKGFEMMLADAQAQSPDIKMVISKEEVAPGKLWKIKLNLDLMLAQDSSALSKKLSGQKVEFYYGLLDDGVMVMALKPDLEKVYGHDQSADKAKELAAVLKIVGGDKRGLFYFSPAQVIALTDSYLKLIQDSTGQANPAEYEAVKPQVVPLKSLVFSGGSIQKDQISGDMFLHIGQ